ncbi:tetratricopeptide repeat protein [Paraburkholderia fungorum]|uniref:tetratricopeptide repeat protein n=1 Tax=Paraburkholderia fungorum TaxID=134537 RepID=UPI0031F0CB1B
MSDSILVKPMDPVYLLWSNLREQGFDAAERRALELVAQGATPQLHADLCASAGRFEAAYHSASQAQATDNGVRHARVALFADALGRAGTAQRNSELAVAVQPPAATIEWTRWLIERCGAPSAAAHMLRAYEQHAPQDARASWWLAIALATLPDASARAERRAALLRAYALDPAIHPALPLQLVLAFREIRDWATVERVCREVLTRDPADAEIAWQLSHAQWQGNDAAAAEATMRAANAAAPGNPHVLAAIGMYLAEQARFADSEAALHAALASDPSASQAAVDLADLKLRRGDWPGAWPHFEARLTRDDREPNNVVSVMERLCPRWQGESLAGKTLLVHSEQGNGDDIQMVRFVPELAARVRDEGGRLVLAVRRALQPLLARFYANCVSIEDGPLGEPDFGLPIMSVPSTLGLRPENVRGGAYLSGEANRVAAWRERIHASSGEPARMHVGLVWSGSPTHRRDAKRSIPLAALAPVLALPNVVFYPLTPGRHADVAALIAQGYRIRDLTAHYQAGFDDVAAHVSALDVVVTIDSAPLHLGGALGRPVLAMLDHVSHWAWGNEETQPWYGSVELFRQPQPGDWAPVVERVADRLRAMLLSYEHGLEKMSARLDSADSAPVPARLPAHLAAESAAPAQAAFELNSAHRFRDAARFAAQMLAIDSQNAGLHHNASYAYNMLGEFDQMRLHAAEAARLLPDNAPIQFNLAAAQLRFGDFEQGWKQYRWHEALPENHDLVRPDFPEWQGEPVAGRRFLLVGEQGLGDQIQFLRLAAWLNRQGALVDVWVAAPLAELARCASGVRTVWVESPPGPYDFWCRMLRMPEHMKLTLPMLPLAMPYLSAEPALVHRWRQQIDAADATEATDATANADPLPARKKRVGLVWAGNPDYGLDRYRSIALNRWLPILEQSGVTWVSLQIGPAQDEAAALPLDFDVLLPDPEIGNFSDTLAILQSLDLVITVDTSVAHLAGAAGRPVWVLLPTCTDWRWMADRDDSPWYPSARLFRQRELGRWDTVLEDVRTALREFVTV